VTLAKRLPLGGAINLRSSVLGASGTPLFAAMFEPIWLADSPELPGVDPCENAAHTRVPMRLVIVTASVAALALGAWWAAEADAPIPPKCSAMDTQRHATLRTGGYDRYCGPGRAVMRLGDKSLTMDSGNCSGRLNGRRFGLLGGGGVRGKGFSLHLEPVVAATGRPRWFVRPGRVGIMDGEVQLPGFSSLPHQGTAIISKDLKSATFSLGSPPRITGNWKCR